MELTEAWGKESSSKEAWQHFQHSQAEIRLLKYGLLHWLRVNEEGLATMPSWNGEGAGCWVDEEGICAGKAAARDLWPKKMHADEKGEDVD